LNCQKLVFSSHAIQQMFFRRISKEDVKTAINYGEVIEEKPDDTPFSSYLILDFVKNKPIHVVFSYDQKNDTGYVVTAYIPDPQLWIDNFRKRR
jgi:hypothetical protein